MNITLYNEPVTLIEPDQMFFVANPTNTLNELIDYYKRTLSHIKQTSEHVLSLDLDSVTEHFFNGNYKDRNYLKPSIKHLFQSEGAIKSLNAHCWSQAMNLTDVYDVMPQKRRDEWNKLITDQETPDFNEDVVRSTIADLYSKKKMFFAERVRDLFDRLSRSHKTNCPEGFYKRMIIDRGLDYVGTTFPSPNYSSAGYINDLRCVVSKFMQRDEPKSSYEIIKECMYNYGQWHHIDAGAIKIRVYKKGTIHIEVHPELAWRINCILNEVSENAIPSQFRTKPDKEFKEFVLMNKPLDFAVLAEIGANYNHHNNKYYFSTAIDKYVKKQAIDVLTLIGAVFDQNYSNSYHFDYDASKVLSYINMTGCVFDYKSYQYYPTPEAVKQLVDDLTQSEQYHSVLEPSAGQGHLIKDMQGQINCVEICPINQLILEAKRYNVVDNDFLKFAKSTYKRYDRVVMNPPFSEGRAEKHVKTAYSLLKDGGVLVAVVPASFKDKQFIDGATIEYHDVFDNEFDNTTVSVIVLKIEK
jgi:hypothetical protein